LKDRQEWIEMASGQHVNSVPMIDEKTEIICETGEIPERIGQYVRLAMPEIKGEIQNGFPPLGDD